MDGEARGFRIDTWLALMLHVFARGAECMSNVCLWTVRQ